MAFQPLANFVITGTVEFGSAPAQSGSIRFSNSSSLVARNVADDGDLPLLSFSESDEFILGNAAIPRLTVAPPRLVFNGTSLELGASTILQWVSDLQLHREGADTLAQRRGTNLQQFRVYETFDSGVNERFVEIHALGASGGAEVMADTSAGATDRALIVGTRGNATLNFYTNNTNRWRILGTGHLHPLASGTYDLGGSGNLIRDVYVGTSVRLGATPAATGTVRLSNADSIFFRNFNDNGDLDVFSFSDSDVFHIGRTGVLEIVHGAPLNTFQGVVEIETTGTPFRVATGPGAATTLLEIESTTRTVTLNDTLVIRDDVTVAGQAETQIRFASTTLSTPSGASVTAAGLIPAGALVLGVTTRVLIGITGPTGFDIGDGVNTDRWGNSIAVAIGTTSDPTDFVSGALEVFPTANDVVITSDGVDFTGGSIRVTVHYMTLAAPVS